MIISLKRKSAFVRSMLSNPLNLPQIDIFLPSKGFVYNIVGYDQELKNTILNIIAGQNPKFETGDYLQTLESIETPEFQKESIMKLKDFDVVIFEYWAEWCHFCMKQMTILENIVHSRNSQHIALIKVEHDSLKLQGLKVRMKQTIIEP